MVSGDYYDFIQLNPTTLAIAVADISGKGISAALLMASLQAALRSLLLAPGSTHLSTAELVSRLNNHLVRNTGDDRFATFFRSAWSAAIITTSFSSIPRHWPSPLRTSRAREFRRHCLWPACKPLCAACYSRREAPTSAPRNSSRG